ncbi:MAG: transporter substrate-binding domain-containing protein [Bacteroides sp.]|nr:transporter substrate-binding domain-containing protein [Bacteroides sp.]
MALLSGVVVLMIMLRGCSEQGKEISNAPFVKSHGDTLDIAIDYGPMSMYAHGDSIGGFNYELLKGISQLGNLKFKLHPFTSLDSALTLMGNGLIDIVIADAPSTLDFKNRFVFSTPVSLDRQVLVEHTGDTAVDRVGSQLDLGGKNVWVVAGSPTEGRLRNLAEEIGDTIYINSDPQYSAELLYMLTSIGQIRLCVINEGLARKMSQQSSGAEIAAHVSFTQFQCWMMNRQSKRLKQHLDSLLETYKKSPAYAELCRRYSVEPAIKKDQKED